MFSTVPEFPIPCWFGRGFGKGSLIPRLVFHQRWHLVRDSVNLIRIGVLPILSMGALCAYTMDGIEVGRTKPGHTCLVQKTFIMRDLSPCLEYNLAEAFQLAGAIFPII